MEEQEQRPYQLPGLNKTSHNYKCAKYAIRKIAIAAQLREIAAIAKLIIDGRAHIEDDILVVEGECSTATVAFDMPEEMRLQVTRKQ